uniref:Uncharacterized protein n=1 Tax=Arundo donax TaxID=35708 RepID=A0A0A9EF88_ARUDO
MGAPHRPLLSDFQSNPTRGSSASPSRRNLSCEAAIIHNRNIYLRTSNKV